MFDIQNYTSFISAILLFQVIPGAGTVAILEAAARGGVRAGMAAVLGTLAGDLVYMTAAMAGLAAVLQANPAVLSGLQWFGAGYLCWAGVRQLRPDGGADGAVRPVLPGGHYARRACAVSLTNPKVMLFFVAFFPLFLRPGASPLTLGAMMAHVTLISLCWQAGLVLAGNAAARRLRAVPAVRRLALRLAGLALIGFGVRLAAGSR